MKRRTCTEEVFLNRVRDHELTVLIDDGTRRHIRFRKPASPDDSFDLITWSWHLCITGDMGTYVFSRIEDMFDFHRLKMGGDNSLHPDLGYWAQKLLAVDRVGKVEERRSFSFHYIWNCYAIAWGIRKYDALKEAK